MANPNVNVIVRAFNCERTIGPALESILVQTYPDFEVIVVDDFSTDGTRRVLQAYTQQDARIKVIRNETNQGAFRSINIGLQQGRANYVAIQDGDDLSLPHRFETQVSFLEANPNIALIGGGSYIIDEEGVEIGINKLALRRLEPEEVRQRLERGNIFSHSSLMFRRECIEAIGFYDEFFVFSHDYEMLIRMADRFEIIYSDDIVVKWRYLKSSISNTKKPAQVAFSELARARRKAENEGYSLDLQQEYNRILTEEVITNGRYHRRPLSDFAYYYTVGIMLLEKGDAKQARKRFLRALGCKGSIGSYSRVIVWYILSFFPHIQDSKLVRSVRNII